MQPIYWFATLVD